jgi:hypothetical protein
MTQRSFRSAGEKLVGHELATERRAGAPHYVTGQHYAEVADPKELRKLGVEPEVLSAVVSYVDVMGHAVAVVCSKEADGGEWRPELIARAGHYNVEPWRSPDETFRLSYPMLKALSDAEARLIAPAVSEFVTEKIKEETGDA